VRDTGHHVGLVPAAVASSASVCQWFSRASVVHGPAVLLPALSVLEDGLLSKIVPRISRTCCVQSEPYLGVNEPGSRRSVRDVPRGVRTASIHSFPPPYRMAAAWCL
jgi:hypothetical protein